MLKEEHIFALGLIDKFKSPEKTVNIISGLYKCLDLQNLPLKNPFWILFIFYNVYVFLEYYIYSVHIY